MYKYGLSLSGMVLDNPFKEDHLVQLNEADVLRVLTETLPAHIEPVLPDQTVRV
jgi:hypothetical protein